MKKSLILFLAGLLMGTLWVPMSVFAQQPANTSCSTAVNFNATSNFTYTQGVYNVGGSGIGNPTTSPCNPNSNAKNEVWFSCINTGSGLITRFKYTNSGGILEIYTGSCGSLIYDTCIAFRSHSPLDSLTIPQIKVAGTIFYFRIISTSSTGTNVNGSRMWISTKPLAKPKRIISKRLVGNWDSVSSWVGNTVPSYNDTVVIDDGSTITAKASHILNPAQLIIGQQDSNLNAKLYLKGNGVATPTVFSTPSLLVINKKDSLFCKDYSLDMHVKGNIIVHGGLVASAIFRINGKGIQTISGTGKLNIGATLSLQKAQFDTVFQKVPINIRAEVSLDSGLIVSSAPIIFQPGARDLQTNPKGVCSLSLWNGAIKNPVIQTSTYYALNDSENRFGYYGNDSTRNLNRYIASGATLVYWHGRPLSTISGNKVFHYNGYVSDSNSVASGRYTQSISRGILRSGPSDTIFFGQGNANITADTAYRKNSGYDVGTLFFKPSIVPKVTDTTFFPFFKFGAKRQVAVSATKKFKAGNQNLAVTVKAIPPTGSVVRPLAYMQGSFVFEINSNRDTLPADAVLRFMFRSTDNFTGSVNNLRMAQAPSPNGPWRSISPSIGNIRANHVYTNPGITLQNGHYFAFGTVDPGRDLSFDWVQTTSPSLIGPGYPAHDLRMQIKNESSVPALEAKVSWTINTPTPITGTSTIALNPPLAANTSTVIGLNAPDFIKVPYTGIFNYTITLDSNISNVFRGPYDTVKLVMDNRPHSLPFTQKYDTVKEWLLPLQYRSKPLNTNAWKWNTNNPCYYNSTGTLSGYGNILSLTEVLTEPLSLPAGPVYSSLDMEASYRSANSNFHPSDSVVVSITLDSGKTYHSLFKLDSADIAGRANMKTLYGQINVPQPVRAHFRIKIYVTDPRFTINTNVDNLRVSSTPLSVQLYINSGPIQIYPNPSANRAFRLKGVSEAVTVQIISLTGQIMHSQNLNPDQEINLPELAAGVYLVKANTRQGNKVVRWVVQR